VIHAYGLERGLRYTLFRPFNWIGGGLDSIDTPKEGSSRVVTQFFGHIVRGEPIRLVDGGLQRRSFTFVDDGIAALMKIIENRDDRACGRIYNVGNPANHHSVRELAQMMIEIAADYPEYRDNAARVTLVDTSAQDYYGNGYQDVRDRVPAIENTRTELDWEPRVGMREALVRIFEHYRSRMSTARSLNEAVPCDASH